MPHWYDHPCSSKVLENDETQNIMKYLNEAKEAFKLNYSDLNSKESPIDKIMMSWTGKSKTEKEFVLRSLENGPITNKLENMGLIISQFPMMSIYFIDNLMSYIDIKQKRFALTAIKILSNLFLNHLLPVNRPLINLKERPLKLIEDIKMSKSSQKPKKQGLSNSDKVLCLWYFEEQMKTRYARFLNVSKDFMSNEPDQVNKMTLIKIFSNLCEKKENQLLILEIMINKFGDENKKVAGTVYSKLFNLIKNQSSVLPKLVRSIRKFIFRPNLSRKAQYYAVQLLARVHITNKMNSVKTTDVDEDDEKIPSQLLKIYVGVFKMLLSSESVKCEKLYSAIFRGISRVVPFTDGKDLQTYFKKLLELTHLDNIKVTSQCLKVLYQFVSKQSKENEMKEAFEKNMDHLQRVLYELLLKPTLLSHSYKTVVLEVAIKSLAIDQNTNRVKAIVKRLLQVCIHHSEPGFICSALLMLSKFLKMQHKSIFEQAVDKNIDEDDVNDTILVPKIAPGNVESILPDNDDSDDEILPDIVEDDEGNVQFIKEHKSCDIKQDIMRDQVKLDLPSNQPIITAYDPFKSNPKFSNVDDTHLTELYCLRDHYHPSVRHFAQTILDGVVIDYKTDPTQDMSIINLLNKFANKALKKVEDNETCKYQVFSDEFRYLEENKVAIHDQFFHKFMNFNNTKRDVDEEVGSDFSDSDGEFDKYLDDMDFGKNGKDGEDADIDDEVEFSDLGDDDDMGSLLDDDDEANGIGMDEEDDDDMDVDMNENIDSDVDLAVADDQSEEEEEDDEDEDEPTIHSSKRRRLGPELSEVTTGAMHLGNKFKLIQSTITDKIKEGRKIRKGSKAKSKQSKPRNNLPVKGGKRKFCRK